MTSNKPKIQELEFEAMNLQVGGRIQFITHRTVKPVQHFSTLIGYVKDEYMIVKIPVADGAPIALGEGDKLTIRVFSGVNVCSFACTVLRLFGRPLNYAHLSFPDVILGSSLRAAMRVRVDTPALLVCADQTAVSVNLLNLSVTGALVESPTQLTAEKPNVTLSFSLPGQPGRQVRVKSAATIQNVNVVQPPTGTKAALFTYGVQFVDLEPTHYTMLQNLTYEALIADRQKIV